MISLHLEGGADTAVINKDVSVRPPQIGVLFEVDAESLGLHQQQKFSFMYPLLQVTVV